MKKKVLFAALIGAVMLTGCAEKVVEPQISEQAQAVIDRIDALAEVTLDDRDEVDSVYKAYNGLTDEEKAEVTNIEQLKNAKQQIHDLWETHPFVFFDIDWDFRYYATKEDLDITAEKEERHENTFGGVTTNTIRYYKCGLLDDTVDFVTLEYKDKVLDEITISDVDGAYKVDKYKELLESYYGECSVKNEEENAFMWYSDYCTAIVEAYPSDSEDHMLRIMFRKPVKDETDKQKAQLEFEQMTRPAAKIDISEIQKLLESK